jgi:hypothetical protein
VLLYKHLPLLFGSSGHVGFPILKTSLFINTKYYAMCGSNDGHSQLGLSEEQWLTLTTEFEQHFCYAAGAEQMMQIFKIHTHRKRIGGMRQAKRLLS